ncbi:hypothetical protein [Kiloniella majae]|uniref:hypothetical protein n=1 Tax=Kiloniella majae TaxID=1938558 RepID=UPI000A2781C4|nr:hypothetical protein [Kiloniella majae]
MQLTSTNYRAPRPARKSEAVEGILVSQKAQQSTGRSFRVSQGRFEDARSLRTIRRPPEDILYPSANYSKPLLTPYTSLAPSPVRRVRGLATLNLYRPEYTKIR